MANIGNLAVVLSLDAVAFASGLEKSGSAMNAFSAGIGKTMAGLSAFEAVGESAYQFLKGGIDELAETVRESEALGLSLGTLGAIQLVGGKNAEEMRESFFHLQRQLHDAATGGKEAQASFASLNLDAAALAKMPMDDALGKIADRFNAIPNPIDRANAAFELFGRRGLDLLPILSKGSAGLAELREEAKRLGIAFSQADAAQIIKAEEAMNRLDAVFQGLKTSLLIELSPIVEKLANSFTDAVEKAGGLRPLIHDLVGRFLDGLIDVAGGAAQMIPVMEQIGVKVQNLIDSASTLVSLVAIKVSPGDQAKANTLFGQGTQDFLKDFQSKLRDLKAGWDDVFKGDGETPAGPGQGLTPPAAVDKLGDSIKALKERLEGQIAAYGQVSEAAERFKLATEGATDAQLAGVDAAIKQLEALKAQAKQMADMEDLASKVQSALGEPDAAIRHPGLALAGSKEDYAASLHALDQGQGGGATTQDRIEAAVKRQVTLQEQHVRELQQIRDTISRVFKVGK